MMPGSNPPVRSDDLGGLHVTFMGLLDYVVLAINAATVLVLLWGVAYGMLRFFVVESRRIRGLEVGDKQRALRRQVGFYLLFGLELLIAADVIETMIRPTLSQLAILGGISLIRIATGYALGREIHELTPSSDSDSRTSHD